MSQREKLCTKITTILVRPSPWVQLADAPVNSAEPSPITKKMPDSGNMARMVWKGSQGNRMVEVDLYPPACQIAPRRPRTGTPAPRWTGDECMKADGGGIR